MKTIFITGGASGLGKETTKQLISAGDRVILLDKNSEKLEATATELGIDTYICCDISQKGEILKLKDMIDKLNVDIDVLVNNAGIRTDNQLDEIYIENQLGVMQVNALGNMRVTDLFIPYFKKKGGGHIVTILSSSALDNHPAGDISGWRYYGASKWALNGYIKSIRKECSESNIKVSAVYPGGFESNLYEHAGKADMHNQPWMMPVSAVASSLLYMINMPSDVLIDEIIITKF